ncbi:MAG: ABC transporter permease [Bacteroidetes bacterium]|nr:ABC transporter permease [Bacteroidota bacterium]
MIRNYLLTTFRTIRRQPLFSFINVMGLAIGLACAALIFLFVNDEWRFDQNHEKKNEIFRVVRFQYNPDGSVRDTDISLPMPLGGAMVADYPEVLNSVRLDNSSAYIRRGEATIEEPIVLADPSLFDIFTFPLLKGQAIQGLDDVVISQTIAEKYFPGEEALGKALSIRLGGEWREFIIRGIAEDIPSYHSVRFDILINYKKLSHIYTWVKEDETNWYSASPYTFIELAEGADIDKLQAVMPDFRRKYYPNEIERLREQGRWEGDGIPTNYYLQPLTDIHLNTEISGGLVSTSDPMYTYILSGIALILLLIACINFTTLAIGRSARRAREIGLRKVVGANRFQLMFQFWAESLFLTFLALIIGLILAESFLPVFNQLSGKDLIFWDLFSLGGLGTLILATLITGMLAGLYPALVLSGFRPVEIFRQKIKIGGANLFTRSLVVAQFTLSVILVIGSIVMSDQIHFMKNKNLGYEAEQIVVVPTQSLDGDRLLDRYQDLGRSTPEIEMVAGSNVSFTQGRTRVGFLYEEKLYEPHYFRVDANYVETLGLNLVDGRNFNPQLATDTLQAILINESFAKTLGWEDPVGKPLTGFSRGRSGMENPVIIGVVKDYHLQSLALDIPPTVLSLEPSLSFRFILLKIKTNRISETIASIRQTWEENQAGIPFVYSFLDEDMNSQYAAEERWGKIVSYASWLTIFVACLGLFGLSALSVVGRVKEIGIRKILGASVSQITILVSRELSFLVLIAFVIAAPIAWYMMNEWLAEFAYRIQIGGMTFLLAGVMMMGITILTISYNSIRAARENPVNALRDE